jgi:TatD DNase family protein
MIYDVHAHLDLVKDLDKVIKNAKENNVALIVTQSVTLKTAKENLKICKKYPSIIKMAAGYYPQDAHKAETGEDVKDTIKDLRDFISKNKKYILEIGEIGMDFSSGKDSSSQEKLFRAQLDLAKEFNLPAIIHTRKAEKEVIEILKDYPTVTKILHCFCGKFKLAKKGLNMGCYFSIPTNVSRNSGFQKILKEFPKEKILTETDTPFLSPFRGEENTPSNISHSLKVISKIWGISVKETEDQIEKNTKKVLTI